MSDLTPKKFGNGKIVFPNNLDSGSDLIQKKTSETEHTNNLENIQRQEMSPSPSISHQIQRGNKEKFDKIPNESSSLKILMENLPIQIDLKITLPRDL